MCPCKKDIIISACIHSYMERKEEEKKERHNVCLINAKNTRWILLDEYIFFVDV
jgi:hypothetical protein